MPPKIELPVLTKRKLKKLRWGFAGTALSALITSVLVIAFGITEKSYIFDGVIGECPMRAVYALYFASALLNLYMVFQECCTISQVAKAGKRYGCHDMDLHQFFMHCVITSSTVMATVIYAIAYYNHASKDWITGLAAPACTLSGMNAIFRLTIVKSAQEAKDDQIPVVSED